ncbi:MAG: hypothetical protein Q8J62_05690 [Candidatus Cloacimonadaceae bacterium]|nr:hypothetical protein [Candidatus Cloacimonadaceae bacterium]
MPYNYDPDEWSDEVNISIKLSNGYFQRASDFLDEARISNKKNELYKSAADLFRKAADEQLVLIRLMGETQGRLLPVLEANSHYYKYESSKCMNKYLIYSGDFLGAINEAEKAIEEIGEACVIIEKHRQYTSKDVQDYFIGVYPDWNLSRIESPILLHETKAKQAMVNGNFINALDEYRAIDTVMEDACDYLTKENIDQRTRRILLGNYYAMKANVANSTVGVMKSNESETVVLQILGLLLDSLSKLYHAYEANPEWEEYPQWIDITKKNLNLVLNKYSDGWFDFITHYEDDAELFKILKSHMKEINAMKYNDVERLSKAKSMSKEKKTLFYGTFWLMLFIIVFSGLYLLANSVSFAYFVMLIISGPVIAVIVSALILRSVGDLSEENFIQLIKLTIKLNFSFLSKKP